MIDRLINKTKPVKTLYNLKENIGLPIIEVKK